MDTNNKTDIDSIIQKVYETTFKILSKIYSAESFENREESENCFKDNTDTRLIIPLDEDNKKNKDDYRLCEQELRFIFVEQLNNYLKENNLYYSIETPTKLKYKFTSKKVKDENVPTIIPYNKDGGESARIDLVIYDKSRQRKALIEFKAKNESDYKTDFLKLCSENAETNEEVENISRYFIQLLTSAYNSTKQNINEKRESIVEMLEEQRKIYPKLLSIDKIKHICYSINIPKNWKYKDHYLFK